MERYSFGNLFDEEFIRRINREISLVFSTTAELSTENFKTKQPELVWNFTIQ